MSSENPFYHLPPSVAVAVERQLEVWHEADLVNRFWSRDATLWTGADEGQWLDWLTIVERADVPDLQRLAGEVRQEGFTNAVVLGMGGSSMCPEVLAMTFGQIAGFPRLLVLDSTDPAQLSSLEQKIDIARTLFIVASKSGSTLEPNIFMQYFLARVRERLGADGAARHFIAITDPGSRLEQFARETGFRQIFPGVASIGGRYSALSNFGLVPAAVMGLDVVKLLARSAGMVEACRIDATPGQNPGVALGAILGAAHNLGRDKLTIVCSPAISDFGAWLEQLVAESTGKQGKAIIPVDREPLRVPDVYGQDRLFVYLRVATSPDAAQDAAMEKIVRAGHPLVRLDLNDTYDLGAEFFRWEVATATAGAAIGINPFDQPDVESAKVEARRITAQYESTGILPSSAAIIEEQHLQVFADERNQRELFAGQAPSSVVDVLRAHLVRLTAGDYFCLLAFIEMSVPNEERLQHIREAVLDAKRVATCLGFGPRFLHSTGQAHKGGPASGVFLQVTGDHLRDLPVPGQRLSFGIVEAAQAAGDFAVLAARSRRLLRIHLRGGDVDEALTALCQAVDKALALP